MFVFCNIDHDKGENKGESKILIIKLFIVPQNATSK